MLFRSQGIKHAVRVPLDTAESSAKVLDLAVKAAEDGKKDAASDALVSAQMAYSGVIGGTANVKINLGQVDDPAFEEEMIQRYEELEEEAREKLEEVKDICEERRGF